MDRTSAMPNMRRNCPKDGIHTLELIPLQKDIFGVQWEYKAFLRNGWDNEQRTHPADSRLPSRVPRA